MYMSSAGFFSPDRQTKGEHRCRTVAIRKDVPCEHGELGAPRPSRSGCSAVNRKVRGSNKVWGATYFKQNKEDFRLTGISWKSAENPRYTAASWSLSCLSGPLTRSSNQDLASIFGFFSVSPVWQHERLTKSRAPMVHWLARGKKRAQGRQPRRRAGRRPTNGLRLLLGRVPQAHDRRGAGVCSYCGAITMPGFHDAEVDCWYSYVTLGQGSRLRSLDGVVAVSCHLGPGKLSGNVERL